VAKHELDEDDRGRVRSGTLPALIERLTLEIPTDPTSKAVSYYTFYPVNRISEMSESRAFSDIFLMTFRTFTTPNTVFDMLLEQYYSPPPKDLPETATVVWIARVRLPLRLRILEIFSAWLEEHRLLEEEPYIAGRLIEFLNSIDDSSLAGNAESLLQTIQRLVIISSVTRDQTSNSPLLLDCDYTQQVGDNRISQESKKVQGIQK
jgi:son of sevenless-like protein